MCKADNVTLLSLPLMPLFLFVDVFETLGIRVEYEDRLTALSKMPARSSRFAPMKKNTIYCDCRH